MASILNEINDLKTVKSIIDIIKENNITDFNRLVDFVLEKFGCGKIEFSVVVNYYSFFCVYLSGLQKGEEDAE